MLWIETCDMINDGRVKKLIHQRIYPIHGHQQSYELPIVNLIITLIVKLLIIVPLLTAAEAIRSVNII